MIILHTGNIATSSMDCVTIYNTNNILSKNEEDYELQKIYLYNGKKVGYVYEFPDETIFCATYSKIFHLQLYDNDKSHKILGTMDLGKSELPSKLISLGNSFLVALIVERGNSYIRLFEKEKVLDNYKKGSNKTIILDDEQSDEK